jgi:hypothetical protein
MDLAILGGIQFEETGAERERERDRGREKEERGRGNFTSSVINICSKRTKQHLNIYC